MPQDQAAIAAFDAPAQTAPSPPPGVPAQEPRPARGRVVRRAVSPGTVLAIASLGVFMEFVDSTIVNIAFPSIREDFSGATLTTLAWIFDAYAIVFAAFLVAFGRLADLLGRKRMFQTGVILFTAASALCALAPSEGFLIAARALQALGGAIVVPASLALVVNAFPPERRARALTAYGSSAAIAAALGPPIGGLLIELSDWRLCFLVNVPIGVLVVMLASRKLVESRSPGRRTLPDLTGALVLAAALGLLTLGIVQGRGWGWTSPAIIGSFLAAVALAVLFVRRCTWHHAPVVDIALLRQREFSFANLATAVAGMGFYGALLVNALYLISVWGYSPLEAGLAFIPAALVAAVTAAVAGRVAERSGYRLLIAPGALIYAAGYLWFHEQVGLQADFLGDWLPGALLSGVGAGLVLPQLGAASIAAARGTKYAVAGALSTTARQLGGALGIALVIVIIEHAPTPETLKHGWVFVIASFGVVALIVATLSGLRPVEAEADDDGLGSQPLPAPQVALSPRPLAPATHATLDVTTWDFLRSLPLISDLPPKVQALLAAAAREVHLPAGEYLFHEGDAIDGIYAVRAGRLHALRGEVLLREHGRGELIGELGVLTGAPRAASIRARRDSELVFVPRADVEELLMKGPDLALAVSRRLAARFQASTLTDDGAVAARAVTIAFIGAGAPAALAAPAFAHTLGRLGTLAVIGAADVGADRTAELDRAERTNDRVLLVADPAADPNDWTEFCMRQADRVVLAGGVTPPAWLSVPVERAELLLPDGADRRAWARSLPAGAEYHVSYGGSGADALARRLAGRSLGLVLGGGGARALAHVGVAEEIERSGLVVDRVGGAGLGALVGALMATGMDAAEVDARVYDELVRRNPFGDYRPSRTSLIRGRRVREMLERLFGDTLIQELPLEFFAVSADLAAGERVVHRTGRVADAVLAAISMPGLMEPVARDGRLLTDAGSIDNLPVAVMAARAEGPIVAVDVSERDRGPALIEPARGDDGAAPLPGVRDALARAAVLGSLGAAEEARKLAAVTVAPESDGAGLLEFHLVDELRTAGRRAAREALTLRGRELEAML
jgi:EmrB/QacA subfamily drug resistance transporter